MIDLPFNTVEFAEAWQDYIDLRERKKKPYKNEKSMKAGLKKLVRISQNNEQIAIAIIENSIDSDWQGLFPLHKNDPLMIDLVKGSKTKNKSAAQIIQEKYGLS